MIYCTGYSNVGLKKVLNSSSSFQSGIERQGLVFMGICDVYCDMLSKLAGESNRLIKSILSS